MSATLTKEDIQFIDKYLSKSDITYEDVRVEIIDHVASAIEVKMDGGDTRGFYEIFKEYMIENKLLLEKQANGFKFGILKNIGLEFIKTLFSLQVLPGSFLLFGVVLGIDRWIYPLDEFALLVFICTCMIAIGSIPMISFGKIKFLFINYLLIFSLGFFYMNYFIISSFSIDSTMIYVNIGVLSWFLITSFKMLLHLVSYYKKRYKLA